jgi:hypothetical protein
MNLRDNNLLIKYVCISCTRTRKFDRIQYPYCEYDIMDLKIYVCFIYILQEKAVEATKKEEEVLYKRRIVCIAVLIGLGLATSEFIA